MPPMRLLASAVFVLFSITAVRANNFPPNYDDAPLRAVTFVDKTEGWAVGDHGVIWHTVDGGKFWERQKSGTRASLRAVQFLTPYTGYAVGRTELPATLGHSSGIILTTTDGGLTWTEMTNGLMSGLMTVKFFNDKNGIVAGDSTPAFPCGIFITSDGGQTWKPQDGPKGVNWTTSSFRDETSGEIIGVGRRLKIENGKFVESNQTFVEDRLQSVKSSVPLNAFHMFDESNGWAVGELGTILNTADGGKTWAVQRSGGQRCGVLFIHANGTNVPFDVLAMLGAKDGQLCGVVQVGKGVESTRLSAVVRECGGAVTECLNSEPGNKDSLQKLVLAIRQWRPETIVTDRIGASLEGDAVRNSVLDAVNMAADAHSFPGQLTTLTVHTVKTVFAELPTTKGASVQFDYAKLVPELADDVRDFCELTHSLLGSSARIPAYRFFASVYSSTNELPKVLVGESLLPRGGTGRRKASPPTWPEEYLAAKEKIAVARRKIDQIVAHPEKFGGGEKALELIRTTLVGLPEDLAARAAGNAAAELARTGQWGMAREMHGFVVESFEPYPEAAEAARWLLTFHTSSQIRRRIELGHVTPLPKTMFETIDDETRVKSASHTETEPGFIKPVYRFKTGETARKWNRFALDLEPKLIAFGPGLARDPAMIRARQLARERVGLMVANLESTTPEWTAVAVRFTNKPKLDGILDDEGWTNAKPTTMALGDCKTETKFGFDDRYLYVAIHATHAAGKRVPKAESRERDADLSGYDRVEFAFDLDRGNGATAFRFAIDHRGCLNESCWGDRSWNPKWFVAFDSTDTGWTAEIAIPIAEITGSSVANSTWGLELNRIVPGMGEGKFTPLDERAELRFEK